MVEAAGGQAAREMGAQGVWDEPNLAAGDDPRCWSWAQWHKQGGEMLSAQGTDGPLAHHRQTDTGDYQPTALPRRSPGPKEATNPQIWVIS